MDLLVHVYPFDTAATLARIEDCTVHNFFRGPLDVDIGTYICGILASELKTYSQWNPIICSLLNRETISYRSGKADELDLWRSRDRFDLDDGSTVEDLQHTIRQPGFLENLLDLLGTGWRLWGRLQNHRVSCKQGRY
jgi:hypothetical protein